MKDKESGAWHSELKDLEHKEPDAEKHECCLAIVLGDLGSLKCDVHVLNFDGVFELKMNYCPHCGTELEGLREVAIARFKKEFDLLDHNENQL